MHTLSAASLTLVKEESVLQEVADLPQLLSGAAPAAYCVLSKQRAEMAPLSVQRRFGGDAAPSWWKPNSLIQRNALRVFYLKEAFVVPKAGVVIDVAGRVMAFSHGEAAYLYGKLSDLPGFGRIGGGAGANAGPAPLARQLVTLPWGAVNNYGHFLLDGLTSAALFQRKAKAQDWEFLLPPLQNWHRGHFDLMKIERRAERSEDLVFCREVMWTSNMDHHLHFPNESLEWLRQAYALDAAPGGDLLWLSRAGDTKRRFARDAELEAKLAERGFKVIRPETMTPQEQVRAFADARVVAGFTGAAFANALFCSPRAKLIEIQPSLMQGVWIRNLSMTVGCEWIPYFCPSSPPANAAIIGGKARHDIGIDIDLDVAAFLAFLDGIVAEG